MEKEEYKPWLNEPRLMYVIAIFFLILAVIIIKPLNGSVLKSPPNIMLILMSIGLTLRGLAWSLPKLPEATAFLCIYVLALATIRSVLFFHPFDFLYHSKEIHHFWFGLIIFIIGVALSNKHRYKKIFLLACGFAAMVDEVFLIVLKLTDNKYWSEIYLIEVILMSILVFYYRRGLVKLLLKTGNRKQKSTTT